MPSRRLQWSASGVLGISLLCTTAAGANFTQVENAKPGDPSWVLSNPATGREIEGYGSAPSINRGESIVFYVNTPSPTYTLEIFRMGWYGGAGARKMAPTATLTGVQQPLPTPDPTTGLIECRWSPSFTLEVPNDPTDPTNWMSGIYLVKLTALDTQKQSYMLFVVRDDSRSSDFLLQNSVTTYQAYNSWGGLSLYTTPRAYKVSFNRPFNNSGLTGGFGAADFIGWGWEYHMLRFLEREGYDVTYTTDLDTHSRGDLLLKHKAFLVVGHDEYWSWQMRDNVEQARDHGVSLGFFAANVGYWQVRFEPSVATGAPNRTMVCYKSADLDPLAHSSNPSDRRLATTLFRWPPVDRPEDALIGIMYDGTAQNYRISGDMVISNASHWVFEGTGVQNGDHLPGLLGYELDRFFGNAPPWIERLTHSPYNRQFCASATSPGCEWHYSDMTVYEAESGATVVATGSMYWNWGLDRVDPNPLSEANPVAQQATRNILERFLNPAPYFLEPRSLTFPPQRPGTESPAREIVIVNHRELPLAIQQVSITGDFKYTNECHTALPTGGKCVIEVSFTPPLAGAHTTGEMDIQLSDDPASPVQVQLAGTQSDFRISAAEGAFTTVTVEAGQDANYGLSLTPIMGFSGEVAISCDRLPAGATASMSQTIYSLEGNQSVSQPIIALDGVNPVIFTMTIHTPADPKSAVTGINIAGPGGQTCLLVVFLLVCLFVSRHRVRWAFAPACLFVLMCAGCAKGNFANYSYHYHPIVTAEVGGVKRSLSLDLIVRPQSHKGQ